MCYSSSRDFGWGIRKHAAHEPEKREETKPAEKAEPEVEAEDLEFLAFLEGRGERRVQEPVADRTPEKV